MSVPLRLVGRGRPAELMSPDEAERHVEGGKDRARAFAEMGRAFRRMGWIAAGVGALLAAAGMGLAAYAIFFRQPEPPRIIPLDASGVPVQPMRAVDAPQSFTDATSKHYLRQYLDFCEVYHADTARLTGQRCLLLMSPPAQERWARWFSYANTDSPQRRLGATGTIGLGRAAPVYALVGKGRSHTEVWNILFNKAETKNGVTACLPWVAQVAFQWRPDLQMSDEDRTKNLLGFQIIELSSVPDTTRQPPQEC